MGKTGGPGSVKNGNELASQSEDDDERIQEATATAV